MWNWIKTAVAFVVMVVGLLFARQAMKHATRKQVFEKKARELNLEKGRRAVWAKKARKHADYEHEMANQTLEQADTRSAVLREKGYEKFADRIDAFNERVRNRQSS